ncbi:MAG: DNA translocase FtsK 4TM domain-containing protein [Alphaproteobacteria bacterium]
MAERSTHIAKGAVFPPALAEFVRRRANEALGLALIVIAAALLAALVSYDGSDPSWNRAVDGPVRNFLGLPGAYAADLMVQAMGLSGGVIIAVLAAWGWRIVTGRGLTGVWLRVILLPVAVILCAFTLATLPVPHGWGLETGLGGAGGHILLIEVTSLIQELGFAVDMAGAGLAGAVLTVAATVLVLGFSWADWRVFGRALAWLSGQCSRALLAVARAASRVARRRPAAVSADRAAAAPGPRRDPVLGPPREDGLIAPKRAAAAPGRRARTAGQGTLDLVPGDEHRLPPIELLEVPLARGRSAGVNEDALAQNARLLESVLDDFGVRGEIVKVRPGPVVALYELEPAPGTKTSRVIGLADDIARSMSAVSARIAVVPGRNVIGIELPNAAREIVYLRELLASQKYERTAAELALVLGKDISGAPVIVDLARMPHLLVAGTTGSGKSVAINAMILSLLYRLPPDKCKLILIDPKMLELSVYEGIPHLIAPVVTEPSKAIVALKWTVREMESRYRALSQLGVRNIANYNARVAEARRTGEVLTRRVQTGFDAETGQPILEEQPLELAPLPLIVVVVDEMADLMLVSGKEIEATIQRLSQMARAAGIHLIMATQRPSVDVITGTIKANFPTRISFQVTSKIDSRTILGEQGAEQLLGQGDMLYMVTGGRIIRVHGPLVRDDEVEAVVNFLKRQGEPTYVEAVTQEEEEAGLGLEAAGGGAGDELYDEALALVAREGKASTSFIQRHLQIGYNRAARIIERMEGEGVVSRADRVGRREVLIGGVDDAAR